MEVCRIISSRLTSIEEKNEEIDHLRNNVQVVFIGHGKKTNGDFGDQKMMANMESKSWTAWYMPMLLRC